MSSTNKTEKIGLSQWESTDPVSVEDFNSDFRILDGLIGGMLDGLHLEQLADVTVAAPNKSNFTVDVSGIDFGKYLIVIVDYISIQNSYIRLNGVADENTVTETGCKHIFFPLKDPDAAAIFLRIRTSDLLCKLSTVKNSAITTFNFSTTSGKYTTDSHIKIWGIR